jgi:hypothetical protein
MDKSKSDIETYKEYNGINLIEGYTFKYNWDGCNIILTWSKPTKK